MKKYKLKELLQQIEARLDDLETIDFPTYSDNQTINPFAEGAKQAEISTLYRIRYSLKNIIDDKEEEE